VERANGNTASEAAIPRRAFLLVGGLSRIQVIPGLICWLPYTMGE
jgi:hypothetical protein